MSERIGTMFRLGVIAGVLAIGGMACKGSAEGRSATPISTYNILPPVNRPFIHLSKLSPKQARDLGCKAEGEDSVIVLSPEQESDIPYEGPREYAQRVGTFNIRLSFPTPMDEVIKDLEERTTFVASSGECEKILPSHAK